MVDELLQRRVERLGRHVHDPGEHLGHEAATDDRAGPGDRLRLGGPSWREAREDGILDGVRHGRLADGEAVGPGLGAQRAEQLLDVERDAVGPLVDRLDDFAWGGQPRIEDQRRHKGGLGRVERREADLFGDPLGQKAGSPVAEVHPGRGLVGAVAADEHERPIARPAGELGDDLETQVVGPLEVLERQQRRLRQRGKDVVDASRSRAAGGARVSADMAAASSASSRAQCRERRHAQHRAPGPAWTLPGHRGPGAGHDRRRTRKPRASACRRSRPGTASCRSRPRRRGAGTGRAGRDVLDPAVGEVEQVVATDQERAASGRGAWSWECSPTVFTVTAQCEADVSSHGIGTIAEPSVIRPMCPPAAEAARGPGTISPHRPREAAAPMTEPARSPPPLPASSTARRPSTTRAGPPRGRDRVARLLLGPLRRRADAVREPAST